MFPASAQEPLAFSPPTIQWHLIEPHDFLWVDARSLGEKTEGSIFGAHSLPLLDNDERTWVGTIYKQVGKDAAVEKGFELVSAKLQALYSAVRTLDQKAKLDHKRLAVYCARGGFRSRAICYLFYQLGITAYQLVGGYKTYRKQVCQFFAELSLPQLVVLQGKTGCGKTKILQSFPNSLDLEALAEHRGSVFGDFMRPQLPQKAFETSLMERIQQLDRSRPILIEGESSKIGQLTLPCRLWQAMQAAPKIQLVCPLTTRVERILQDYLQPDYIKTLPVRLEKLAGRLGRKTSHALQLLLEQAAYPDFVRMLLELYYDPKYDHHQKKSLSLVSFDGSDLTQAKQEIAAFLENQPRLMPSVPLASRPV